MQIPQTFFLCIIKLSHPHLSPNIMLSLCNLTRHLAFHLNSVIRNLNNFESIITKSDTYINYRGYVCLLELCKSVTRFFVYREEFRWECVVTLWILPTFRKYARKESLLLHGYDLTICRRVLSKEIFDRWKAQFNGWFNKSYRHIRGLIALLLL